MSRKVLRWSLWFFAAVGVIAVALGVWLWATYPSRPDVASADLNDSLAFMGSEDFNRMFEFHQRDFALALVEKMREKTFEELIGMMLSRNPVHKAVADNLRHSPFRQEVESALANVMLDKFYEQPESKRNFYLTMAATMGQRRSAEHPSDAPHIPSPDRLKKNLGEFMSRQPPAVQGKAARLIMDLRKVRRGMGMKDPF
jgi:hypothetical protein